MCNFLHQANKIPKTSYQRCLIFFPQPNHAQPQITHLILLDWNICKLHVFVLIWRIFASSNTSKISNENHRLIRHNKNSHVYRTNETSIKFYNPSYDWKVIKPQVSLFSIRCITAVVAVIKVEVSHIPTGACSLFYGAK